MLGRKSTSNILWLIFLLVALFLAFTRLGPAAGILLTLFIIGFMIYRRRSSLYHNAARRRFTEGDTETALVMMKKAVLADPGDSALHASCGFMLLKIGRMSESERMLTVAANVAKTPEEKFNVKSTMALLLWKKGRLEDAIAMLDEVMEKYKTTTTYATMGFFRIERGNVEDALAFNREAYAYNDRNPIILDNYACALMMAGDNDGALKIFEDLMKLNPTFPDAWYNYGRLLEVIGQNQKAVEMYQTAISKKFWHTSTVKREEVEFRLGELEQTELEQKEEEVESHPGELEQKNG